MGVLENLEAQARQIRWSQSTCKHEWQEPVYTPYNKEEMTLVYVKQGSDIWPDQVGTGRYRTIPCWTRTCKICGKEERTEEQYDEVILSRKAPKFGK